MIMQPREIYILGLTAVADKFNMPSVIHYTHGEECNKDHGGRGSGAV
jgi:hypothetical protein